MATRSIRVIASRILLCSVVLIGALLQTGCTVFGAAIGGAIGGRRGAARGARAGLAIDAAVAHSAVRSDSGRRRARRRRRRRRVVQTPLRVHACTSFKGSATYTVRYLNHARILCEADFGEACRCETVR